jgi:hypothetical protein
MDLTRFNGYHDGFDVIADLRADLEFKTSTSIGFQLHQEGYVRGWVEVHHPCDGHIKARIRGELSPSRAPNLDNATARQILDKLFVALRIPQDETYEAEFVSSTDGVVYLEQCVDRDGLTDRSYFIRKPK